jgi:carboxynorspermidine decarboxylase
MNGLTEYAAKTPFFLVDIPSLRRRLEKMRVLAAGCDCAVLLAPIEVPPFLLPYFRGYVDGTAAKTLEEARLGRAHLGGITHLAAAAYRGEDMGEIAALCSHVSFGSVGQVEKHRAALATWGVETGLTVSPDKLRYPGELDAGLLREHGISGLRLTFCAASVLDGWRALEVWGKRALKAVRWLSFGRGFSLCGDEERAAFCAKALREIKERCGAALFIETGHEAAQGEVHLLCTVLDILPGAPPRAVLDTAVPAAYPKIRPLIHGAGYPGEKPYNLRLMGMTGAPGDVFGDYSFDRPLEIGQRLLLRDVAPFAAAQSGRGQMHLPFLLTEEL